MELSGMTPRVIIASVALSGLAFLNEGRVSSSFEELRNNNQQATARILAMVKGQYPEFNVENFFAVSDGTLSDLSLRVDLIPKGTNQSANLIPSHRRLCNEKGCT